MYLVRRMSAIAAGVASAIAALAACGDHDVIEPLYPIEGGPSPHPIADARPEREPSVDAGPDVTIACEPLPERVDVVSVRDDPNNEPFGGIIPAGVFKLTSAVQVDDGDAGVVLYKRGAVISFSQTRDVAWHFDKNED